MVLKLYNTLGRKKQVFKPLKSKSVEMYSCGPTVYWYQHIGNIRSYVFADVLKRVLNYDGFKVKQIINITDVGHLTSDGDEGEDKMEKAAKKEGRSAREIADYYFKVFEKDLDSVNFIMPDKWVKASEHIKEQIDMIKKLEEKGFAYKTDDGVYFDTSKVKNYGELGLLNKEGLETGKRVDLGDKKSKTDFALWKFSEKGSKRQQEWKSPWGVGFPGWHIECSAMSSKYLGKRFDIHTGGMDHITVHHTNEIAQSESALGVKGWVKYWLHGAFLNFGGEKISKSKGGFYTLTDLFEKGYDPLVFRYYLLTGHYRTQMNFTLENLDSAKTSLKRLKNILSEVEDDGEINEKYLGKFEKAIDDDLDMPGALAVLWSFVRDSKAVGKVKTVKKMDGVFGLDLLVSEKLEVPVGVLKLVKDREKARVEKDWAKADKLRDEIAKKGFKVDDSNDGSKVSKM
jgi:cysteinyl-tRNA synthetase